MWSERNSKYFYSSTQNEGGRDMIKLAYLSHRGRVTNVKSVVDSQPPRSYARKPVAMQKRIAEKKTNPDPTTFIRMSSPRSPLGGAKSSPRQISKNSEVLKRIIGIDNQTDLYRAQLHLSVDESPSRRSTTSQLGQMKPRNQPPPPPLSIIRPNTAHQPLRTKSTPHVRSIQVEAKEQYYKEISQDLHRYRKLRTVGIPPQEAPLTEEEKFEKIINNTPRIRHDMPHPHVQTYDAFVKMLMHYNDGQVADILQGARAASRDLKLLSQFGKEKMRNLNDDADDYHEDEQLHPNEMFDPQNFLSVPHSTNEEIEDTI